MGNVPRVVAVLLFLALVVSAYIMSKSNSGQNISITKPTDLVKENKEITRNKKVQETKGKLTINNIEESTELPIKNTEFTIKESSGEIVEVIVTDESGRITSQLLDYGKTYLLMQSQIEQPYARNEKMLLVEINQPNQELTVTNEVSKFITSYQRTEDGKVDITELYIPVDLIMQNPELPNGCEITSLTSVLNSFGYQVSKLEMADDYLPKQPFAWKEGKRYGPDPYIAYGGNPRNQRGAFFSYAPPILKAATDYLNAVKGTHTVADLSGKKREEIIEVLEKGIPVVTWITIDLKEPRLNYSWYFYDTDEYFLAPVNLHAVVLNGYVDDQVHVMDPLKGQVTYNADIFFESYIALGSHAMIVVK
jgi:uncharacterized protein YvpB